MESDLSTKPTQQNSPQESIHPPTSERHNSTIVLWLLMITLFGAASYFGYQNWRLRKVDNNKIITTTEPTVMEQGWSVAPQTLQSIREITNQLISNTLQLSSTNSGVPMFTKEFDLSQNNGWANFVITVYKYSPGAKLNEGYEGLSWTRYLDSEVKELRKVSGFKNGMYINQTISAESGQLFTNITVKDIGNQKYAITDTYFPPSRSWHRKYQTYNQKTNNIIDVTMGIRPEKATIQQKNICYEDKCALFFFYPEAINNFFLEQESLMEE